MLPNQDTPQPGADVSRPDTINPLEDKIVAHDLKWLRDHYPILSGEGQQIASLAFKLWHHIQRLDGAWRIQQDRLIDLEERLKEVEWWQGRQDSYSLEQSEYNED